MIREVTLNYSKVEGAAATFEPNPKVVRVAKGDAILFKLGNGPDDGKIRITFKEPQFFARPRVEHGDGSVAVQPSLNKRTTYRCELFVAGKLEASADGDSGGAIEPTGGDT